MQFAPAKAQWVTIPDTNFAAFLTLNYPSCMNGNQMDTTCTQITNAIQVDLPQLLISDLTGISYFDNLNYLYCFNNLLTTLGTLPNNLIGLYCNSNQLTQLPSLPQSLMYLDCSYNQLMYLPLLPVNLLTIDCSFNQLTYLPQLPEDLYELSAEDNNISCFYNLPPSLVLAGISNNPITCVPSDFWGIFGLPICVDNDPINNPNNCVSSLNISGSIYSDLNSNCTVDSFDLGSNHITAKLYNSSNILIAQDHAMNGTYGFSMNQAGTYKVKIESNNMPYSIDCAQADSQMVNLMSTTDVVSNINFPVNCNEAYDVYPQSVNNYGWVFPGQVHQLETFISSNEAWYNLTCGATNYAGVVSIIVTGAVSFYSVAPNALIPTVNGNTFTYNITDYNSLNPSSFGLKFLTDTTAQAGDQICVHVEINPTPLDADTTNNVYDFCYQVVNSYDPNMKEVYPVNVLPGYDDWFTYTIHFQNTGNAPAFNIRLRDTLDANLDINSFEVRGYSHPAQISLNGNILTVRFNNIMLPDSTTDYDGSMGYFQYRLKPLPNLPNGTQIENTAYIYFDYNAPIITNTTQNNFDMTVKTNDVKLEETHFVLYPNPSEGLFMFKDNKNIKTVEVFNMMGELVLSQGTAKIINLQGLPKGIYVARINGTQVCRLVKE
jgi:uncharacterized repeat protein (TIGR01451 family)